MNVGILANPHKPGSLPTLRALRETLARHGIGSVLESATASLAGESDGLSGDAFCDAIDVAAVIGGDGTMLHALSKLGGFRKPVAGINIGTLGFLTSCTDDELDDFASALAEGRYETSQRSLLSAIVTTTRGNQRSFLALNEVTLARGETGRLVSLRAKVNGEHLNDYRADGLIVATPTGSTAYSLSAGGPLVSPHAEVLLITPICPHSLSQRALVIADNYVVELSSEDPEAGAMLFTVDGRDTMRIEAGDRVVIRKSDHFLHLLRIEGSSFYAALRQKLGWQGV